MIVFTGNQTSGPTAIRIVRTPRRAVLTGCVAHGPVRVTLDVTA